MIIYFIIYNNIIFHNLHNFTAFTAFHRKIMYKICGEKKLFTAYLTYFSDFSSTWAKQTSCIRPYINKLLQSNTLKKFMISDFSTFFDFSYVLLIIELYVGRCTLNSAVALADVIFSV